MGQTKIESAREEPEPTKNGPTQIERDLLRAWRSGRRLGELGPIASLFPFQEAFIVPFRVMLESLALSEIDPLLL